MSDMSVLINFKICDNSPDCNGIKACPQDAIYWDEDNDELGIDNEKCVSCGKCGEACEVGAIRVAQSEEEYQTIQREIENDPRQVSDLFVDRYGAEPISQTFETPPEKFYIQILRSTKLTALEVFQEDSIHCLLHSIPISDLFEGFNVQYRKMEASDDFINQYQVDELPALLFFKDGDLVAKIEGHYKPKDEDELREKVKTIVRNN